MSEGFSQKLFLRGLKFPFCPGCGNYAVIRYFLRAVYELGYRSFKDFVFCSGIGCAAWIPSPYFLADSIHTPHGRSIPIAIGVKLVRPELNVVVFGGDGDLAGIGLSHLIHAARRNADITVFMINNQVYGMTGGQVAPTTFKGMKTTSTPYGNVERPLDISRIITEAGACYVARWTTAHGKELKESMKKAISTEGFSFVEILSQCPTMFGRHAGFKSSAEIIKWFREKSVPIDESRKMSKEELVDKIIIGEFNNRKFTPLSKIFEKLKETIKIEG
ncbi:2-oxoacid:ferredoxin oxidoreductase subunit beta [Candidatus Bathyarchaeota archaeon]|nr:MAG: 2-oxoacid:ferredoxin oxidoreductase subunit beta [Candidatus Bathyarchaeota archaeon]